MLISNEELEKELNSSKNLSNSLSNSIKEKGLDRGIVVIEKNQGRTEGTENKSQEIKEAIVDDILNNGLSPKQASEIYNTSESQISQYLNGRDSASRENEELKNKVLEKKTSIKDIALNKLLDTMGLIDIEEIKAEKVGKRIIMAKDLAAINKSLEEEKQSGPAVQNNIIFYSPKQRNEKDYGEPIKAAGTL